MDNFKEFEKFGKYILIRKIAIGGMAEIFLVKTEKTEGISQFAVLKRILPQFSSEKKFRVMFKNEGKIASHLKHQNLVYHHEFGVHRGTYFIVMEYIAGVSLKDFRSRVLKIGKKIPLPVIGTLVRSIASALYYINNSIDPETGHPLNLIHRDVTPHNMMIGFNGDIKLIDFGIAKMEGADLTSAGVVKGKFRYMSPEQISGSKLTHQSDIFSLGVVFWELLTGRKLFNGSNVQSIFQKIKTTHIPSVTKYRPDVHPELSDILSQMLRKNPSARFSEAEEVERQLSLFLNKQHTSFSYLDFKGFVKNLYSQEIEKERKFIVSINKKLTAVQKDHSVAGQSITGKILPLKDIEPHADTLNLRTTAQISQTALDLEKKEDAKYNKKKLSKPNSFQKEPTALSPQAPLSYSRTQIFKKNLDNVTGVKKAYEEECTPSNNSKPTLFSDLSKKYLEEKQSISKKTTFKTYALFIAIGVLAVILFKNIPQNFERISSQQKERPQTIEADFNNERDNGSLILKEEPLHSLDAEPQDLGTPIEVIAPKTTTRNIANTYDYFRVYIDTNPSGAFVSLNGKKINKTTPVFIDVPNIQNNVLEVARSGYETFRIDNLNSTSEINVKLKKIKNR